MSVMSGVATFTGASSPLNGRLDAASLPKRARDTSVPQPGKALRIDPSILRIVERVSGGLDASAVKQPAAQNTIAKGSGKYMRFVDAVQALRLNTADAARMSPARVEELKEAAAEVFDIHGVPREQRPAEVFEEQRLREAEREARDQAERVRVEDAERAAKAVDGGEADLPADAGMGTETTGVTEKPQGAARVSDGLPDAPTPRMPEAQAVTTPAVGSGASYEPKSFSAPDTGSARADSRAASTESTASLSTRV